MPEVRRLFERMLPWAEVAEITAGALALQRAFIDAGVVSVSAPSDALHVLLATTSDCRVIVSWSFRHIVHFEKIRMYNAVNTLQGYREIAIHSPGEVIGYGDEDV